MKKVSSTGNRFFYLLFCLSLTLTWFFHKDATRFNDRSELWADRAGYYIYLPATFFYHFDARKMPADLDILTGGGFSIDTLQNKVDTKYTCGVALLASPFFITSSLVSAISGYDSENGFSMIYIRMMGLAAVVYLIVGLWFLKKFLDHYFHEAVSYFTITVIFLGTNLFYYSLIDGMMSHVYSFALFALFLYALKRFLASGSFSFFILLCVTLSLAVLIRPTNILLGLLFFTWDAATPAGWMNRIRQFLQPRYFFTFIAILFLVFLPQLIYWKHLSGNWLYFSYAGEGFANWRHPRIGEVLVSPLNGLLATTPMLVFPLAGTVLMILRKRPNGWLTAVLLITVTMVCASWEMWYFGCSLGQRPFIEYYPILAVPFAWLIAAVWSNRSFVLNTMVLFLVFLLTYANLRHTVALYRFERCYYGSTWDWEYFRRSLERAGVIPPLTRVTSFKNDFENLAIFPGLKPSEIFTRSGQYSVATWEGEAETPLYSAYLDEFDYPFPKKMDVRLWILKNSRRPTDASLGYHVSRGREILFGDELPLDHMLAGTGTWTEVRKTFIIPDVSDSSLQISLFIRNPQHAPLYADDLLVRYTYPKTLPLRVFNEFSR